MEPMAAQYQRVATIASECPENGTIGSDVKHVDPAIVVFGQTRRRLLAWLLLHPDETVCLRQLARQTEGAPGAIQRELAALTPAGILSRAVQGRQVRFGANRESPIYLALHALVVKTMVRTGRR